MRNPTDFMTAILTVFNWSISLAGCKVTGHQKPSIEMLFISEKILSITKVEFGEKSRTLHFLL